MNPQLSKVEEPIQYNLNMERERTEMNTRMRMLEIENKALREEIKMLRKEVETQLTTEGGLFFDDLEKGVQYVTRLDTQRGLI
ncbi:MAG: hypothetical protein WC373_08550 [Smithella sp.]|jgi:predicted nuclease with TOPRIM domain